METTTATNNGCKTWENVLAGEKQQPYFQAALDFVKKNETPVKSFTQRRAIFLTLSNTHRLIR